MLFQNIITVERPLKRVPSAAVTTEQLSSSAEFYSLCNCIALNRDQKMANSNSTRCTEDDLNFYLTVAPRLLRRCETCYIVMKLNCDDPFVDQ